MKTATAKLVKLTKKEQQKAFALAAKDIRVQELYKTLKERPLNVLEQIMLGQILHEYKATSKHKSNYLALCKAFGKKAQTIIVQREKKDLPRRRNIVQAGSMIWGA